MAKDFYTAVKQRRTCYALSKETTIPDERIQDLIKDAVKYTPSAFNSQSGRVVILFGEEHNQFWELTKEALRKVVAKENFPSTEQKINSFRDGYGTVLFFEDMSVIEELQKDYASYKDNFPVWSQQASGMLQYVVWTSLSIEGLGASLQHYNELIEEEVKKQWKIPEKWKLIAQMPFGKPTEPAGEKDFMPVEDRVKIVK